VEPERRAQLLQGKLRALTTDQFGSETAAGLIPVPYLAGAAAFDEISKRLMVLVEPATVDRDPLDIDPLGPRPPRGFLGGAIVAAARQNATELHLIADGTLLTGDDARRAARCSIATFCWSATGRSVTEIRPSELSSALSFSDLPPDEQPFANVMRSVGAEPVVEQGVLRAEVLGLEVGRVVRDPESDQPYLAVGVGKHDRLAQSMMNGAADPAVALAEAVKSVAAYRIPGVPSHPANRVSRSRWLREILLATPEKVQLSGPTVRIPGTVPIDLKAASVAAFTAFETLPDHENQTAVVVGCAAGVDLDGPTDLLDTAARAGISDVRLVVLAADDFPAIRTLCATLTPPIGVVALVSPLDRPE
jgi:hypothetical protein